MAETVNPHSPPALKAFWLDLTHRRPLYPESMLMLADECGFEEAKIVFPNGTGNLDFDLRMCGSYAVVATRGIPEVTNFGQKKRGMHKPEPGFGRGTSRLATAAGPVGH